MVQEENRFFHFLWRLDAILLALAGLLAIGLILALAIQDWISTDLIESARAQTHS